MTNAHIFRTGLMETFSVPDLNLTTFTFVGRLATSDKGLDVFLKAVNQLKDCQIEPFSVWIVGGTPNEAQDTLSEIERWPNLREMHRHGNLIIWQRLDPFTLPEIYSRSTVLVMPSRRETFGIVAIQAQACGLPIIVSKVGGLQHLVLEDITGLSIDSEDYQSLSWAMMRFIKNQKLARLMSAAAVGWSLDAFHHEQAIARLNNLQLRREIPKHPLENIDGYIENKAVDFTQSIMPSLNALTILSVQKNIVASFINTENRKMVIKIFRDTESVDQSIFKLPETLKASDHQTQFTRMYFADSYTKFCTLIGDSWIIYPYKEPTDKSTSIEDIYKKVLDFSMKFPPPDQGKCQETEKHLAHVIKHPNWENLTKFDTAIAELHQTINKEKVFVRSEPLVEGIRIKLHLEANSWPFNSDTKILLLNVCERMISNFSVMDFNPVFQHGDLKPDHLIINNSMIDFDEVCYTAGSIDMANYIVHCVPQKLNNSSIETIVHNLHSLKMEQEMRDLTFCWIVVQVIYLSIHQAIKGNASLINYNSQYLQKLVEQYTKTSSVFSS